MKMATNAEVRPWLALYAPDDSAQLTPEFRNALAPFGTAATRLPGRPAIRHFDATLSFAESDALAAALVEAGMRHGDRVALFLRNVPQFAIGENAVEPEGGGPRDGSRSHRVLQAAYGGPRVPVRDRIPAQTAQNRDRQVPLPPAARLAARIQ